MPKKKNSILLIFGSIAAVCLIIFEIATWRSGPEAFIGWTIWLGRSLVLLLAAIAAIVEKRAQGGAIGFRAALKVTYGVLVMGLIAENLFVWLIPSILDPAFNQRLVPLLVARATHVYTGEQLRQVLDDIRTNNQFSLSRVLSGTAIELVPYFIIAALIAASVKTPTPRQGR